MNSQDSILFRAARWLTFGSAVSIWFSIAASHTLLALAFAAFLASGAKARLPRIKWPLGLFLLGTLISLAFSGDPVAGLPQVRKIFVFLILLLVFSTLRDLKYVRWIFLTWAGFGAIAAARGFVQYAVKLQQAHALGLSVNDPRYYTFQVSERITGFTSHWNTYSGQLMFTLIMLGALILFMPRFKRRWLWISCGLLMMCAVYLAQTRGVWIAVAAGALYLLWCWRRWFVALVPAAVLLAFLVSPAPLRSRLTSVFRGSQADSNQFRIVTWRTGLKMIQAHPFLGLGPEEVKAHFEEYVPADVPRPLPTGWYGHLHSIYLHYAAERGIPTMLALMWALGLMLFDFWRGLRSLPAGPDPRRFILHGAFAAVLATLVEGVVELNLGDSEVLMMFLIIAASGYLALELSPEAPSNAHEGTAPEAAA
jgi:putative inorganic carbon (hco3(-)) transporter